MAPDENIFEHRHADFRGLAWPGREYVLGTNRAHEGIVAKLPAGKWTVTAYDTLAKTATSLATAATGDFTFAAPASRAVLFHFKRL